MSKNHEVKRNCAITVFFVDDQNKRVKRLDPFRQLSNWRDDSLNNLVASLTTKSRAEVKTTLSNFVDKLNNIAEDFMTPGHLLLARTYFQLAQLFPKSNYFENEQQKQGFLKWTYFCALQHLYTAKELEPFSTHDMMDAYCVSCMVQIHTRC